MIDIGRAAGTDVSYQELVGGQQCAPARDVSCDDITALYCCVGSSVR